jgi:miniconductance mechanosensitive channel
VILLVIIWTIIALLSVFDDILSKSPVLKANNYELYSSTQYWVYLFVGGILILSVLLGKESFLGAMGA